MLLLSAGIYSGIWVRRILIPVSGKSLFYGMADHRVFMLGSRSLLLDKRRQAELRGRDIDISKSLNYFDNFTTLTPPLTSPNEVRDIIKKLQNRKAADPDPIPNIALKYLTLNALTHLTKIYSQCLIKNHFPTLWID
ncbi:hypothetical protein TNCV_4724501 [Trichonephila clavipes]|uniref:Uncharacterized protein n=1 Tax=Trichonephila clavipes TaxID=2585209 RepID=A0A8X6W797_TRICX|nr:hypothetical protein TNCV_4724501 [Trichonephila clavipes]